MNGQDDLWESADGGTQIYPILLFLSLPLQDMRMGRDGSREQLKKWEGLLYEGLNSNSHALPPKGTDRSILVTPASELQRWKSGHADLFWAPLACPSLGITPMSSGDFWETQQTIFSALVSLGKTQTCHAFSSLQGDLFLSYLMEQGKPKDRMKGRPFPNC